MSLTLDFPNIRTLSIATAFSYASSLLGLTGMLGVAAAIYFQPEGASTTTWVVALVVGSILAMILRGLIKAVLMGSKKRCYSKNCPNYYNSLPCNMCHSCMY